MKKTYARLHGFPELQHTLKDVSRREAVNILRGTVYTLAQHVRDVIRENTPMLTGRLRRAIKAVRNRGTPTRAQASVVADLSGGRTGSGFHWHWLEYGTVKMSKRPFVNPAVERVRPQQDALYRDKFGKQYERVMERRKKKRR